MSGYVFRGEPATIIEQRQVRSLAGKPVEMVVIKTGRWDRICVLPRELRLPLPQSDPLP